MHDVRHALRSFRTNPGFPVVAIALLALGAGANTAIFQLFDAIRLRTLPVNAPQQLIELRIDDMTHARGNWLRDNALTNPLWEEIRKHQGPFSGMFAWASESLEASRQGESHQLNGLWVSGDFFHALGITPAIGRFFTQRDDRRGCGLAPGAVISYEFWQRNFGGDSSVPGKTISIGEHRVDVIGVTPPGFFGVEVGRTFDVALPICSEPALDNGSDRLDSGASWWLTVMGRLKPGVSIEQASAMLKTESPQIFRATLPPGYPTDSVKPYLAMKLFAIPAGYGISHLRDEYSRPLTLLLAITGLVLLIACVNLANLMLARANQRQREIAVRRALGASQIRIARQILAEGLLIAICGTAAGVLVARVLSQGLISFLATSEDIGGLNIAPDFRVFAFTAGLAVVTCLLFSAAPVLRAARIEPGDALKSGGRAMTTGRERAGMRRLLVAFQIAVALVLLVNTLLFMQSLRNLDRLDPGLDPRGVLFADIGFSNLKLSPAQNAAFRQELLQKLRAMPGVKSAAEMTIVPLTGADWNNRVWSEGSDLQHAMVIRRTMVGPDYFRTIGTPLLAGRDFTDHDLATYSKVAVVNQEFARQFAGGANVIGKRFWLETTPYEPQTDYEIIGVAKNSKYHDLREDFQPQIFFPLFKAALDRSNARIMMRSSISPGATVAALRTTLARIAPGLRYSTHVFDTWIQESLIRERLMATLSAVFGVLAIALTAIGLYGVISYMVGLRANEIGIRIALGAGRGDVIALILRESAVVLTVGLAAGAVLAFASGRATSALLYGLKSHDVLTFVAAMVLLAAVTLLASYVPARRGAALDPAQALRAE